MRACSKPFCAKFAPRGGVREKRRRAFTPSEKPRAQYVDIARPRERNIVRCAPDRTQADGRKNFFADCLSPRPLFNVSPCARFLTRCDSRFFDIY